MSFSSQKEATFAAVTSAFSEFGIKYDKSVSCRTIVDGNKNLHTNIIDRLVMMIESGEMPLSSKQKDNRKYCVGLLNNWLRRDLRLNGGVEYVGNVGTGSSEVRNLKALLAQQTDEEAKMVIQAEIDKLIAEKAAKKAPAIDETKIPEHLKKFLKVA